MAGSSAQARTPATRRSTIILAGICPGAAGRAAQVRRSAGADADRRPRLRQLSAPLAAALSGMRACASSTSTTRASAGSANGPGRAAISPRLTRTIADAGAAAIAFDIVFSEPDRTSPAPARRAGRRAGREPGQVAALRGLPDPRRPASPTACAQTPSVLGFFLTQDRSRGPIQPKAGFAVAGSDPGASITAYSGEIMPLPRFQAAAPGLGFVSHPRRCRRHHPPRAADRQGGRSAGAVAVRRGAAGRAGRRRHGRAKQRCERRGQCRRRRRWSDSRSASSRCRSTSAASCGCIITDDVPERTVPAWRDPAGQAAAGGDGAALRRPDRADRHRRNRPARPGRRRRCASASSASSSTPRRSSRWCSATILYRPDWVVGLEMAMLLVAGIALALAASVGSARSAAVRRRRPDGGGRRRQLVCVQGASSAGRSDRADAGGARLLRGRRPSSPICARSGSANISTAPSTAISRPSWSAASPTIPASSSSAARSAR